MTFSPSHANLHYNRGFTLIELAIALVVIGLIIGGVLVGRDLIESSKIRSQISQIEEIKTAVNTFKLKYRYLPADIPPSETSSLGFFTFTGASAGRELTDAVYTKMCGYGNNDGRISRSENFVFWRHLSEAKLIKGIFGVDGSKALSMGIEIPTRINPSIYTSNACRSSNVTTLGSTVINVTGNYIKSYAPATKLSNVNFFDVRPVLLYYDYGTTAITEINNTSLSNYFVPFGLSLNFGYGEYSFTVPQIFYIDNKLDDGMPISGNIRELNASIYSINGTWDVDFFYPTITERCTTGTGSDLSYNHSTNQTVCAPAFLW